MTKLFFEGLSNSGESDLFEYDGAGAPVDLTASFDGGNGGVVDFYDAKLGALGVDPGPIVAASGSDLFFYGNFGGLQTLWVYNDTNGAVTALQPRNAWGSGIIPQDIVAVGSKVFFVGINKNGQAGLWKSNGTSAGTKQIANSPTDLGDMTLQGANLYFRDNRRLEFYNTATGAFGVVAGSSGVNPQDVLSAFSSGVSFKSSTNLFMAGTNAAGKQNIYMQNGSSLEPFKSNVYSGGMVPYDLTAVTALNDSGVYFSGVDNANGERGLYFVNAGTGSKTSHQAIDEVPSSFGGAGGGLDPYDLTAFDGELYFTGDDGFGSGRGLFVYDPLNKKVTELIDCDQLDLTDGYVSNWGAANAPTLGVYNGDLFFGAANLNVAGAASVPQLYEYSGSGSTATLVSVDGQGNIFGGQPANLIKL